MLNFEIVVLLVLNDVLVGVFDIDSFVFECFIEEDEKGFVEIV